MIKGDLRLQRSVPPNARCVCVCGADMYISAEAFWLEEYKCNHAENAPLTEENDYELIESMMLEAYESLPAGTYANFVEFQIATPAPTNAKHKYSNGMWGPKAHVEIATKDAELRTSKGFVTVEHLGEQMTLSRACKMTGVRYSTARARLASGLDWRTG